MTWKPHVTVAAVVQREDRFLLVEERIAGELVINQPAGHLEPGESLIDAVIRETLEETAWRFVPEYLLGIYQWTQPETQPETLAEAQRCFLRFCFAGQCGEQLRDRSLDEDIERTVWLTREELATRRLRSPMVMHCVSDYLRGRRYPLDALTDLDPR